MIETTTQISLLWSSIFWLGLATSLVIGFIYFRDLGDVTQMLMKVKRKNMLRFIRKEYQYVGVGLAAASIAGYAHLAQGAGSSLVFWLSSATLLLFYGFTYVWVHYGLRHQQTTARYYSIDEAREFVSPATSVIVLENEGEARAHPDYEIWRPHLAGNEEGLGGKDIILTYCSMTNLGHGYVPEINGQKLELEVLAQHSNNLIMRDNTTGEPIQQMLGYREADGSQGSRMQEWPTFRMSFRGFERAYPEGKVFLNRPSKNPLLWLVDFAVNSSFAIGIAKQNRVEAPLMDNMSRKSDDRLPNKTNIWGFNIGDDYICYTQDFIHQNNNLINARVGERDVVIAYDQMYESVGIYYNDTGKPISSIDFFGCTPESYKPLARVESVKAGMFWHVWADFHPNTDINRVERMLRAA